MALRARHGGVGCCGFCVLLILLLLSVRFLSVRGAGRGLSVLGWGGLALPRGAALVAVLLGEEGVALGLLLDGAVLEGREDALAAAGELLELVHPCVWVRERARAGWERGEGVM